MPALEGLLNSVNATSAWIINSWVWAGVLVGALGVAIVLVPILIVLSRGPNLDHAVEEVRLRLGVSDSPAEKQYALLREYAAQGLVQARVSFWVSHVAAGVGFVVIIVGVVLLYFERTVGAGLVSTVAGTVTEAVSVLFFRQTNKTRELMIQTFDRLRTDRKLDEALRLLVAEH